MRAAERSGAADKAMFQRACDRGDHRDFESFGGREIRQDAGKARGKQRLARAGRADHQQIVTPGGGDFERALGDFLPLDLFEVVAVGGRFGLAAL